jgi:hypothetical protein
MTHRTDYERGDNRPLSASKFDLEALAPVYGKMLLMIEANR